MKKVSFLACSLLLISLLTACGKKAETNSTSQTQETTQTSEISKSSSSTSSTREEATTQEATTEEVVQSPNFAKMNLEEISKGDFSSVIGRWENKEGNSLTFNSLGLVGDSTIQGHSILVDGALEINVSSTIGTGGFALVFIPSGTSIPNKHFSTGTDTSDINRDRMFGTQSIAEKVDDLNMYYRLVSRTAGSSANPLTNIDTGVALESGQSTIDYANAILGPLNWQLIESNYNRTESIPFELLRGDNGALYRVYRNGVILSQTKDLIVYMP